MPTNLPSSILFIDGTNLDHRLSEAISDRDINYAKLFEALSRGTMLLRTHFCTADYMRTQDSHRNAMRQRQLRTLNQLSQLKKTDDVFIHKGRHHVRNSSCHHCHRTLVDHVEKGTDVRAATLFVHAACMKMAQRLILVANDNDYLPAIELSKLVGAHVTLAYVATKPADHRYVVSMREAATDTIVINEAFMDGIWLEKPSGSRTEKP